MSSPVKKASTGGIRKTTIKNNLYLKNRAALRERGFFILRIASSIKELPYRGFDCFMNHHGFFASRSYHGALMPKSSKGPPLLPKQEPQRTPVPSIYRQLTIHAKKTANTRSLFYTTYLCFRSLLFARRRISGASGMFMPCDPQRCRYAHRGVGPGDEADQHDQCEVSRGIAAEEVE